MRSSWLLIDGYNLLHASGVFGAGGRTSLESSREALLDWLGDVLSHAQRARTTIVFDARCAPPGLPRSTQKHGISVRFARRRQDADEVIEQLIERHSAPRQLVVVSSDHRLHRAARRRRAQAVDSEVWVARIRRRRDRDASDVDGTQCADAMTDDELRMWLDEFDLD